MYEYDFNVPGGPAKSIHWLAPPISDRVIVLCEAISAAPMAKLFSPWIWYGIFRITSAWSVEKFEFPALAWKAWRAELSKIRFGCPLSDTSVVASATFPLQW